MEFNWLVVLGIIWMLMNLIGGGRKKTPPPKVPRRQPAPTPLSSRPDATQQEGSRLERMLRELERALEESTQIEQVERPTALSLPSAEEVEERQSLETDPQIVSLEGEVRRESRPRIDLDDEAEQIEARRIAAAASRDRESSKKDHAAFDQRIRQEPADHTATQGYTAKQLRDAVVWREILGPPVSLRDREK
jgi:hypothetical protein